MNSRKRRLAKARRRRLANLSLDWRIDSRRWRGRVLTGVYAHWCHDWDGLPMDETCYEWPCACAADLRQQW